jgi:hypothetical protein
MTSADGAEASISVREAMAWKIEKWLSDVFPGRENIYAEYRLLPRRELAVVAAAVLDIALAELLSNRLVDSSAEYEDFLGLDGDGRAPCGSFGARIQLGLLVGVITPHDAAVLRTIKNIRNVMAHRVRVDFTSPEVLPLILKLHDLLLAHSNSLIDHGLLPGPKHDLGLVRQFIPTVPEAGAAMVLSVLTVYQAYFHLLSERIVRIDGVVEKQ